MKRVQLFTLVVLALALTGAFASVASAAPTSGASRASIRAGKTPVSKTTFSKEYDASEYYGPVACTGKRTVNGKYPNGREVETCVSTAPGGFVHLTVGAGQTLFENTSGGFVSEWESDDPEAGGQRTTNYTYKVFPKLKKFKIIAIY